MFVQRTDGVYVRLAGALSGIAVKSGMPAYIMSVILHASTDRIGSRAEHAAKPKRDDRSYISNGGADPQ